MSAKISQEIVYKAGHGSNYDTYRRSNLPDHQTTCLIRERKRARERERDRKLSEGGRLSSCARDWTSTTI